MMCYGNTNDVLGNTNVRLVIQMKHKCALGNTNDDVLGNTNDVLGNDK